MERKTLLYLLGALLFSGIFYFFIFSAPGGFPIDSIVSIEKDVSLGNVSAMLQTNKIIRSRPAFEFFVIMMGGEKRIRPGFYSFSEKMPVFTVAWRVSGGKFFMAPVTVTIPEGFDSAKIADAFDKKLPNFDKEQFLILAQDQEGRLFPDTYFFLNTDTEKEVIVSMTENYEKKISPLRQDITALGRTEQEIITMASIIEGEAKGNGDRGLISGILWKRISLNMPLQADAAPETYKQKGLPEKPVGNPGLEAIIAALRPENSPYLYYLHDEDGNIHYAETFAEHKQNKLKYLK